MDNASNNDMCDETLNPIRNYEHGLTCLDRIKLNQLNSNQ